MITLRLLFGLLCGLAIVVNGKGEDQEKPRCEKPVPFACFVHQWEESHNTGADKHAFEYGTFIDDHCKNLADCPNDPAHECPKEFVGQPSPILPLHANAENPKDNLHGIVDKGHMYTCNPTNLFCDSKTATGCYPIITVKVMKKRSGGEEKETRKRREDDGGTSTSTTATGESSTSTTAMGESSTTETGESSTPPVTEQTSTQESKPAVNSKEPYVEVETIITMPICRRGDSVTHCKEMATSKTNGRFCLQSDFRNDDMSRRPLPWTNIKDICTIVESPFPEGMTKWFADYIVADAHSKMEADSKKNVQLWDDEALHSIWQHTGFPHSIITDKNTNFLPYRFSNDSTKEACPKYAKDLIDCHVLPICDDKYEAPKLYLIKNKNAAVKEASPQYEVKVKEHAPLECEVACTAKDDPRKLNCRVLDLIDLSYQRQDSPPYASLMSREENFNKKVWSGSASPKPEPPTSTSEPPESTPAPSTSTSEPPESTPAPSTSTSEASTANNQFRRLRREDEDQNQAVGGGAYKADIKYPNPVNLASVKDEAQKKQIEGDFWLSPSTNPFYLKAMNEHISLPEVEAVDLQTCDGDKYFICTLKAAAEGLATWIVAVIVVGAILPFCCLCVVIIIIVATVVPVVQKRRKKAKTVDNVEAPSAMASPSALPEESKESKTDAPTSVIAESSAADVEKSSAMEVSQTGQAGTETGV